MPGNDYEVAVESGDHEWNAPWPRPARTFVLHGLESDLADVIDDPEAHQVLLDELEKADPRLAAMVATHTRWAAGTLLDNALMFAPPAVRDAVERRLGELNEDRRRT